MGIYISHWYIFNICILPISAFYQYTDLISAFYQYHDKEYLISVSQSTHSSAMQKIQITHVAKKKLKSKNTFST